jgi:hypothetical protein
VGVFEAPTSLKDMASASISHEVEATQKNFPPAQPRLVGRVELRGAHTRVSASDLETVGHEEP